MGGKTEVEFHVFINHDGRQLLGPRNIILLREIVRSGSVRTAAMILHMSYQHAWTIIDEMNQAAPHPVVVKQRGGIGGGGAVLTEYGQRILKEFHIIEADVTRFQKRLNTELNL